MRLRALLETDALGLRLLGGAELLDRPVLGVLTTDLRDPGRYLAGGELVLSGLTWRHGPEDSERFAGILAAAGAAALAAGEAELSAVPDDLVAACARHRLPLFAVHEDVSFATVTEYVVRRVSTERAGDLAAVVDRHRRLMAPGPAGGGPDAVLDLLRGDLDLRAWVLAATGRTVAGGAPPPREVRERLAAARTGRVAVVRVPDGGAGPGGTYSLFPIVSGEPGAGRPAALSDWFLAVRGDAGEWSAERRDLLHGVTQLVAVERDRRDAARTVRRGLAQEVLDLLRSGAPAAEVAARLRVAARLLVPGLGAAPAWQLVVARLEWPGDGGNLGAAARALLEETLVDPLAVGADAADRIAVAVASGGDGPDRTGHPGRYGDGGEAAGTEFAEAVALVPLPALDDGGPEAGFGGVGAAGVLAALGDVLAGALAGGRLTAGVSAAVRSAEGLRGALEEARHARRVAAARPGPVTVAGHEELASHVLLLPFVPEDVRRAFTARLLDPLRAYDRRHRAELLPTLEAFLAADGSWARCAARLHVHVNTLRYRIGRIEQLTGRDLTRLEDKTDFFLALRMR
jgi:hypothetical protein